MEDGRGSSGIDSGKSIGLAEGILLPAEPVESNRSRPNRKNMNTSIARRSKTQLTAYQTYIMPVSVYGRISNILYNDKKMIFFLVLFWMAPFPCDLKALQVEIKANACMVIMCACVCVHACACMG